MTAAPGISDPELAELARIVLTAERGTAIVRDRRGLRVLFGTTEILITGWRVITGEPFEAP